MKDSGVEWIGDIPADWQMVKLKVLFNEVKNGNDLGLRNALKFSFGNIVTKPVHEKDDLSAYTVVKCDDVVVNGLNLEFDFITQRVGIVRQEGVITSAYISMRPTKYIVPQYGCYMLKAADGFKVLHSMGRGLRQILAYKELSTYLFVLPPLQDQKNIVAQLDIKCADIDKVIEKTRATIEKYKKLKQAIITEAVTKGVRGPRPMKPSGVEWIGDIPEEWGRKKIGHVATFFNGDRTKRYPQPSDFVEKGVPFINSSNLDNDELNVTQCKYITSDKYNSLSGAKIKIKDIIICLRGSIGKCCINNIISEGTVASSLAVIRSRDVLPEYLLYCLLSDVAIKQTDINMNGTCAANLAAESVAGYFIPVPLISEQQEIATNLDTKCAEIDSIIEKKEQLIEELGSYKKSLIYEYVTGKKEVKTNMELKVPCSN